MAHTLLKRAMRSQNKASFHRLFLQKFSKVSANIDNGTNPKHHQPLTVTSLENGIFTITMNDPKRLNAWTQPMLYELQSHFSLASSSPSIKVTILTGTPPYYCAGVHLSSVLRPTTPYRLHAAIVEKNQQLFDIFLDSTKPIIAAVNGPAIGASVTSAALCDVIIASDNATFSTPFHRFGFRAEGCASVHFPRLMGEDASRRMMGEEGWVVSANEGKEIGLVEMVVPEERLLDVAKDVAKGWIETGKTREISRLGASREEYKIINESESVEMADNFLSDKFLEGQGKFLASKGKTVPAMVFGALRLTRPIWGQFLPQPRNEKR